MIYAEAGDVGFANGRGNLSRAIRYVTTGPNERRSYANHTLMFTTAGAVGPTVSDDRPPRLHMQARAIEALWHVEENPWYDRHRKETGYRVMVYRPNFLSGLERQRLVETTRAHLGERYGWWKLGTHLVDRILFGDRKVVSNLLRIDSRPICSYLIARGYEIAGHREAFGPIQPEAQDPDEMHDHVEDATWLEPKTWRYIGEVVI